MISNRRFRYSKSLWLSLDYFFDPAADQEHEKQL
jgi:hypothetical protein